jgi:hypothetical protein
MGVSVNQQLQFPQTSTDFPLPPPAGTTLTSHWGGKQKSNVTLGQKAESPLRKAESEAINLPGPF